jgi:thioredoxin-like negative regulator of GroEL
MNHISETVLAKAIDYPTYRSMTSELLAQGKTTGENHSEAMINYTELNETRMSRLDKTTKLTETTQTALANIDRPLTWLTLTEAWCGDAAQILPVLEHMAKANPNVELRLILRDEHPEVMNAFLTNGGKSIPKVIIMNTESREVLGSWGPRPAAVQQMVMDTKAELEQLTEKEAKAARYQELVKSAQKWYARDKTRSIQQEFLAALKESIGLSVTTL